MVSLPSPGFTILTQYLEYRKVCIVLEELKVPYKIRFLELPKAKEEAYLKINPNGRLPAIWDPNHNMTLWEVRENTSQRIPTV